VRPWRREFFVGSVANYCLHRCKQPVVIFRSPPMFDALDKSTATETAATAEAATATNGTKNSGGGASPFTEHHSPERIY